MNIDEDDQVPDAAEPEPAHAHDPDDPTVNVDEALPDEDIEAAMNQQYGERTASYNLRPR